MSMPGFAAEASLYKTNNHYRFSPSGGFQADGNAMVTPQGCGWIKGSICGGIIVGGIAVCTASCVAGVASGGISCGICWVGYLGALYGFCKDCIPEWMKALIDAVSDDGGGSSGGSGGSGGSTSGPCHCPVGTRCCGTCVKVSGRAPYCDGDCVARHKPCLE
jgi:hypothetical protein